MLGYRRDIETQRQILWKILSENIVLHQVIKEVQTFGYDNAYVGVGCIASLFGIIRMVMIQCMGFQILILCIMIRIYPMRKRIVLSNR